MPLNFRLENSTKLKKKTKKQKAQMGLISPTWVFATICKRVKWMVHGRNLHLMINDGLKIQMCFFKVLKSYFCHFFSHFKLRLFLKVYYHSGGGRGGGGWCDGAG